MTDETPRPDRRSLHGRHGPAGHRQSLAGAGGRKCCDEKCGAARRLDLRQQVLCRRRARRGRRSSRATCRQAGPRRSLRATARPPSTSSRQLKAMPQDATHLVVSVGGNNALGEKAHDRGERALGGRGARQARQDQGRVRQELRRHARRRAGAQAAGRGVHHLRGALSGPDHAPDRRRRARPCSTTSSCARRSPAACR